MWRHVCHLPSRKDQWRSNPSNSGLVHVGTDHKAGQQSRFLGEYSPDDALKASMQAVEILFSSTRTAVCAWATFRSSRSVRRKYNSRSKPTQSLAGAVAPRAEARARVRFGPGGLAVRWRSFAESS